MTDEPKNENNTPALAERRISPFTLRIVQEAAEEAQRHAEMVQKLIQDQPSFHFEEIAKEYAAQQKVIEDVMRAIPKIDLSWVKEAFDRYQAIKPEPVYMLSYAPVRQPTEVSIASKQEEPQDDKALLNAIERLAIAQEKTAHLLEEAQKKKSANKKKIKLHQLVLDKDGHFFIKTHPKKSADLSKTPQTRKFLNCLRNEYISTETLVKASDCKTKDVFYQMLKELRRDIKNKIGVKNQIIQNDPKLGYRLIPGYTFLNEWQD